MFNHIKALYVKRPSKSLLFCYVWGSVLAQESRVLISKACQRRTFILWANRSFFFILGSKICVLSKKNILGRWALRGTACKMTSCVFRSLCVRNYRRLWLGQWLSLGSGSRKVPGSDPSWAHCFLHVSTNFSNDLDLEKAKGSSQCYSGSRASMIWVQRSSKTFGQGMMIMIMWKRP